MTKVRKRKDRTLAGAREISFQRGRADAFLEIAAECDNSFKDGEWHPWASRVARTFGAMCRGLAKDALSPKGRRPT